MWAKFLVETPKDITFDKYVDTALHKNKEAKKKRVINKAAAEDAAARAAQFFDGGE